MPKHNIIDKTSSTEGEDSCNKRQKNGGASKSREGCVNCKQRRAKCDLTKPECLNCGGRGLKCKYMTILHWQRPEKRFQIAIDLFFKQNGAFLTGSSNSTRRNQHFINAETLDFREETQPVPVHRSTVDFGLRLPSTRLESLPRIDGDICSNSIPYGTLMDNFLFNVSPRMSVSGSKQYTVNEWFLPVCFSSEAAYYATLSVSSALLSRVNSSAELHAKQLKRASISILKKKLTDNDEKSTLEIMTCLMLYCLGEIAFGNEQWTHYLKLGKKIISMSFSRTPESHLYSYITRFFAYHDVLGRTACGESINFGNEFWSKTDTIMDSFGCSSHLMYYISEVTTLSRSRKLMGESDILKQGLAIEEKVKGIIQLPPRSDLDGYIVRLSECKRKTTLLVLRANVMNKGFSDTATLALSLSILQDVEQLMVQAIPKHLLLWPLFVVASILPHQSPRNLFQVDIEELRAKILDCLEVLRPDSLTNVEFVRKSISKIWLHRDLQLSDSSVQNDPLKGQAGDWSRFIAPLTSNIALT